MIAAAILDRLCTSARQQAALHAFARTRLLDLLDTPTQRTMTRS